MIAFLGMGLLGSNFVRALRTRGEDVHVWNRTFSRAKALEEVGAKAFEHVADAVKGASRIHIVVSDDAAVDTILASASASFEPNVIIVDHTTTTATGARSRSKAWRARGFNYIHAPVFMGPANALDGTGSMLISGDQVVIKSIEPALSKMTGSLNNLGEDTGLAAAYKLLGNHLFLSIADALRDTFALGKALGISVDDTKDFVEQMGATPMKARLARLMLGNYDEPTWELLMARKDARLMQEEATSAGQTLDVIPVLGARMDAMIESGHGNQDWTVFAKDAVSK
jgi:3-hydroxyisobutyrate dehydrogenase